MKEPKYKVLDVCNYIINRSWNLKSFIPNLRLQKLLYFTQALFILNQDCPCFKEQIQAWEFGPVVPEAYSRYSVYCAGCIPHQELSGNISDDDAELVYSVVNHFKNRSSWDLVYLSHLQDPWRNVYKPNVKDIPITNDSIKEYFCGK